MGLLAPICVLVFVAAMAAPIAIDQGMLTVNSAQAEKGGNGKGGGKGNGPDNAPGHNPGHNKDKGGTGGGMDPEASIGAEDDEAAGEIDITAAEVPLIAEDLPPANVEVIKEIADLPERSSLSEEEELEAIRNGWGSWRSADAPAGTAIQ